MLRNLSSCTRPQGWTHKFPAVPSGLPSPCLSHRADAVLQSGPWLALWASLGVWGSASSSPSWALSASGPPESCGGDSIPGNQCCLFLGSRASWCRHLVSTPGAGEGRGEGSPHLPISCVRLAQSHRLPNCRPWVLPAPPRSFLSRGVGVEPGAGGGQIPTAGHKAVACPHNTPSRLQCKSPTRERGGGCGFSDGLAMAPVLCYPLGQVIKSSSRSGAGGFSSTSCK